MESERPDHRPSEADGGELGIGALARASGLPVSALRFYDGAGVLVPAVVDPRTGYRRYDPGQLGEARLVAALRRVGMPLADIRLALAGRAGGDPTLPARLLAAHVRRLEHGVAEARRELSRLRTGARPPGRREDRPRENAMNDELRHDDRRHDEPRKDERRDEATLTLPGDQLADALDAVRFAVGADPELPSLAGVLFDVDDAGERLRLVATDRYRLALAGVALSEPGAGARALVAAPVVDAMRALLTDAAPARLTLRDGEAALAVGGRRVAGPTVDHEYPDYRRLVDLPAGRRVTVDTAALRAEVAAGPVREERSAPDGGACEVSVLTVTDASPARLTPYPETAGAGQRVAVNREFLTEALAALGAAHAEIEIGGPAAPLALRPRGGASDRLSLLMPVRLDDVA
ncbi:MerR family transcriptional regulator [Streptomyces sedi]|uniref:MerR family transcriptional regulator n=1 Tax=Streptomyces sedi TaxID=555059 RepID=A0A5C4V320_9ACTN|nr:MerR family transcriptional regulator [Streptomyces sedi]TNM29469.1 MerR family transcriptional regulator [Streptomyces sedi]